MGNNADGYIDVCGPGARLAVAEGGVVLGNDGTGIAEMMVQNGGEFVMGETGLVATGVQAAIGTGSLELWPNGRIGVSGGSAALGTISNYGGHIDFYGGHLGMASGLVLEEGGLLGPWLSLYENNSVAVGGATRVLAGGGLSLYGGGFSTGSLSIEGGVLDWYYGTLALTQQNLVVGAGELLGRTPALTGGKTLYVANQTSVAPDGLISVTGGAMLGGSLLNQGTVLVREGYAGEGHGGGFSEVRLGTLDNFAAGRIFVGRDQALTVDAAATNDGRIVLEGGAARLAGGGTLANRGVIMGDGEIEWALVNGPAGRITPDAGRTLLFSGPTPRNEGLMDLAGGTLEFLGALTNAPGGLIAGQGTLRAAGGLANQGAIALSGGFSNVHGDMTNAAGGSLVVSGGATATFYDDVVQQAASTIRVSPGCAAVFLGNLSGAVSISGTGTVYQEGDLRPGLSPADVSFGGDLYFSSTAGLEIELGGTTPGSGYDRVNVAGTLGMDGTLRISLIDPFRPAHGNVFQVLTFGDFAGSFDAVLGLDLGNRLTLVPTLGATDLVLTAVQGGPGQWRLDAGGAASAPLNWTAGVPNGAGDTATLGTVTADDYDLIDNAFVFGGTPMGGEPAGLGVPEPATPFEPAT
jgi:hypothetical protein